MARRTPLYKVHLEMGARMIEFAGWDLPVQYHSALDEHHAVRQRVGVFDVSHMGQFELIGSDAQRFAQRMTCNDVSRLKDGQAQYSAFLTDRGTFVDDIVVYRFGEERIFICVNAATREKDFAWLQSHLDGSVTLRDRSDEFAQIAVQGPMAEAVLARLTEVDLAAIPFYWFTEGEVAGVSAIVSRTGYTGESGFELYVPCGGAEAVWRAIFESGKGEGIAPAGLAARNTLRLEMKYSLYGNDIDETTTPLEAGLGWIVKLGTGFVGEDVLVQQKAEGVSRKLVGFELLDRGVARDGFPVLIDGQPAGKVTSGGFSPTLEKSIGLAYLPAENSQIGQAIEIEIRGKNRQAAVVKTPFLKRP